MTIDIPRQEYLGSVLTKTIGSGATAFTVGGDTAFPFCRFEGEMPNAPRIGIQVPDCAPQDWAEACTEPYKDVLDDPVAWALKAQNEYGADFIQLWLKSTDPNGLNRSAEEAVKTARAVADAIDVPLLVWGTANVEKDAEVLSLVAEECADAQVLIGPVDEANHKQLGAKALAHDLSLVANSPIDINLAKQLNILLNNLGVPLEKIIIDPTTGGLGYGLEYSYSVMERIRQAALAQDDQRLQCPFLCNLADEVWKCKEAKMPSEENMGDAAERGIIMEAVTAVTLLGAGAGMLVMRHPEAVRQVRTYIAQLGGFEMPEPLPAAKTAGPKTPGQMTGDASMVAERLREGALCEVVKIMDMPMELAPGYAVALIKALDPQDERSGLLLSSGAPAAAQTVPQEETATEGPKTNAVAPKAPFEPLSTWEPIEFKEDSGPAKNNWREIVHGRDDQLQHVKTDLHYWYDEGYGSERRKKPA
jgi:acetyl-CoA decarbonylase/synthase complex subunit delta